MTYSIEITPKAKKSLSSFQKIDAQRIADKIRELVKDPYPRWTEKLKAQPGYRIAIGNYIVIYSVDNEKKLILILNIGNRKNIYE